METVEHFLNTTSGVIWGPMMLTLLVGVGIYLTVGLRAITWRRVVFSFRLLWHSRSSSQNDKGDITPFQALMTALSATVGSGNIAGVATAIYLGGPGAVFWMWVTALFGMASKYGEAVLAVHFREIDELGNHVGGPMYYIQNGLGSRWQWLAIMFSLFGTLAAFGIGNTVQANTVATAVESSLHLPVWISGLVMAVFTGAVIIGGVRRLGAVAATLVPFMAISYFAGALIIILLNGTGPDRIDDDCSPCVHRNRRSRRLCRIHRTDGYSLWRGPWALFQRSRHGKRAHCTCGRQNQRPRSSRTHRDARDVY